MSTRAVIARETAPGRFSGRYHHFDGYPSGLGYTLWHLYRGSFGGSFARNLKEMQRVLLDEHPAGWSSIDGDWDAEIGYGSANGPECYCHGHREDEAILLDNKTAKESACEFAYLLQDTPSGPAMLILSIDEPKKRPGRPDVGTVYSPGWYVLASVPMDAREPNWEALNRRVGYHVPDL